MYAIAIGILFLVGYCGIGIIQTRTPKPANFWGGEVIEGYQLKDMEIKTWNLRHGILWIALGIALSVEIIWENYSNSDLFDMLVPITIVAGGMLMYINHKTLMKKHIK